MNQTQLDNIINKLASVPLGSLIKQYPKPDGQVYSKSEILARYRQKNLKDPKILKLLKKKPIRTLSGVTTVTVLTKPFPCPGECIFCPVDVRMPKSYIASEPGAQRAGRNGFDPYLQVFNRLLALKEIGHPTSKVELIVLGGTWSVYPEPYQIWFIKRLFDALNDFGAEIDDRPVVSAIDLSDTLPPGQTYNHYVGASKNDTQVATWDSLAQAQIANESSLCRSVGLVLETRPDNISIGECLRLRKYGATKIQIGIQSLQDQVLLKNKRGHTSDQTRSALNLLRQAGFKLHCHWMPNLYGSTPDLDLADFDLLFSDPSIKPDELKVYPCSLIDKTELMEVYNQGKWTPYTREELYRILSYVLTSTPEYCRLSRIIRDIPGDEIVTGNKTTNFRQIVEHDLESQTMHDIRSREIKGQLVEAQNLHQEDLTYETTVSTEHFLQFVTHDRKIAGFLRLSLPKIKNPFPELEDKAIIREVHVYGQSLSVGTETEDQTQHQGLGKKLITTALEIAYVHKFTKVAVISAIGTRGYYRKLGFLDGILYQSSTSKASK